MIDQAIWREGLKAPDFEPIIHDVHNVIVHHSARSNLVTDYTSAIRNIYLYHNEVRGWSDIGYNYVVAANGDIYKGCDPGVNEEPIETISIFTTDGKLVKKISNPPDQVDLLSLNKDIYILVIESGGLIYSKRIIKR